MHRDVSSRRLLWLLHQTKQGNSFLKRKMKLKSLSQRRLWILNKNYIMNIQRPKNQRPKKSGETTFITDFSIGIIILIMKLPSKSNKKIVHDKNSRWYHYFLNLLRSSMLHVFLFNRNKEWEYCSLGELESYWRFGTNNVFLLSVSIRSENFATIRLGFPEPSILIHLRVLPTVENP